MLTVKNIRKIFGTRRVLERVSFSIGEGQKVALVGENGVGKSTLLRIIGGLETPDKGDILIPNRALVGYLPQEALAESDEVLGAYLRRMAGIDEVEQEMKGLENRMDEEETLHRFESLQDEYRRLGGYDFKRKARAFLDGLCLSRIPLNRPVEKLSGGEKRKAALAGVLLRGVDVLLLDEPTNNLDLPALLWLERYLGRSSATCLIASHDRNFLDNTVSKVIELDWHRRETTMYAGGFTDFSEMKAHRFRRQKELYRAQEEERDRLRASMDEKKEWADVVWTRPAPDRDKLTANYKRERAAKKFDNSAKALESRGKRLEKNGIERPLERAPLIITLSPKDPEAKDTIVLKDMRFGYPGGYEGGPISREIPFQSRVAILGDNGAGKSTLLKTITGEIPPLSGSIVVGSMLRFGYLMQEHEHLPLSLTPLEWFRKRLDITDRDTVLGHLSQFQFAPDVIDRKISSLSPGERVRFILMTLSAAGANSIVLDEPTNHLDLDAIEALEESLEAYPGTILLVTHDRQFLKRMRMTESFLLEDGKLVPVGDYGAYEASVALKVRRLLKRLEEKF